MANPQSTSPHHICLSQEEWNEIEGSTMGFYAALRHGAEDEGEELLRSVYQRLSSVVVAVQRRIRDDNDDPSSSERSES